MKEHRRMTRVETIAMAKKVSLHAGLPDETKMYASTWESKLGLKYCGELPSLRTLMGKYCHAIALDTNNTCVIVTALGRVYYAKSEDIKRSKATLLEFTSWCLDEDDEEITELRVLANNVKEGNFDRSSIVTRPIVENSVIIEVDGEDGEHYIVAFEEGCKVIKKGFMPSSKKIPHQYVDLGFSLLDVKRITTSQENSPWSRDYTLVSLGKMYDIRH